jgi:hypothetical protein
MAHRGHIFVDWWVDCGRCGNSDVLTPDHPYTATEEAQRLGWKKTRKEGWVCPKCLKVGK